MADRERKLTLGPHANDYACGAFRLDARMRCLYSLPKIPFGIMSCFPLRLLMPTLLVGLLVGRGQEGLALGDAQRVGRDPGVELQDRVRGLP